MIEIGRWKKGTALLPRCPRHDVLVGSNIAVVADVIKRPVTYWGASDKCEKSGNRVGIRWCSRIRVGHAMAAQVGQSGILVRCDIIGFVESIHTIDADQECVLDLPVAIASVISLGRDHGPNDAKRKAARSIFFAILSFEK
jgi:hypothetical protein